MVFWLIKKTEKGGIWDVTALELHQKNFEANTRELVKKATEGEEEWPEKTIKEINLCFENIQTCDAFLEESGFTGEVYLLKEAYGRRKAVCLSSISKEELQAMRKKSEEPQAEGMPPQSWTIKGNEGNSFFVVRPNFKPEFLQVRNILDNTAENPNITLCFDNMQLCNLFIEQAKLLRGYELLLDVLRRTGRIRYLTGGWFGKKYVPMVA